MRRGTGANPAMGALPAQPVAGAFFAKGSAMRNVVGLEWPGQQLSDLSGNYVRKGK